MTLSCHGCTSTSLEWVGHRPVVRCKLCGLVWGPRHEGLENVEESISLERSELPEKGNAFGPYTIRRLNGT